MKEPIARLKMALKNPVKKHKMVTILWMRLVEKDKKMVVAIETTGRTSEQLEQAVSELSQRLGQLP
jgi:hypothetical protein